MERNQPPVWRHRSKKEKRHPDISSGKKATSRSQSNAAAAKWTPASLREEAFASLPDAVLVCDQDGTLSGINDAALALFEISSAHPWLGTPYREFLQRYTWWDERQRSTLLAPWLLTANGAATPQAYEQIYILGLPSGQRVLVELHCSLLLNNEQQANGMVSLFHKVTPRYQKALHLQHVYEAIALLNEVIAQIPEHFTFAFSNEVLLLSPPVLFVAQRLVDVIRQVLDCWRVSLVALGLQPHRLFYAVGSGFTNEQEEQRRTIRGHFLSTELIDETAFAPLYTNQEIIIGADRLHFPPGTPTDFGAATLLIVPLCMEQRLVGILVVAKQGWDRGYSQEEIDLVKAVAAEAILLFTCLGYLQKEIGKQLRELVLHEVDHLSRDFLTLASHELRTPLTGIKGNLQLSRRRLEALRRQLAEEASAHLERVQQSLAQAEQGIRLQERMIQDVIDDARIQANQLDLSLKPCDLLTLISAAVAKQQVSLPERVLKVKNVTAQHTIPVLADAERISQVIAIYLEHALNYAPAERPVAIRVSKTDGFARVSVHDDGPGIPLEEQERLWGRFYRGKGGAVHRELDLSLGLSFYLCQAIVERHHGSVGVESKPGRGATFWFTLPEARSAEE